MDALKQYSAGSDLAVYHDDVADSRVVGGGRGGHSRRAGSDYDKIVLFHYFTVRSIRISEPLPFLVTRSMGVSLTAAIRCMTWGVQKPP